MTRDAVGVASPPAAGRTGAGEGGGIAAPFLFTLRTKGAWGFASRMSTVLSRFGPTPRRMVRQLQQMLDTSVAAGLRPTCPITATVLARHPESIAALADGGMEFAVHGLRHIDHLAQDDLTQAREVSQALGVFERCGVHPTGFRAPYLRANAATASAVRAAGLRYQSDEAVHFAIEDIRPGAQQDDRYRRAITMYDARDAATVTTRPSLVGGLVQIPVCIPDDEMIIDRLHLAEEMCAQVWSSVLRTTHDRGDLFTMQVHPERFGHSARAVAAVLSLATELVGGVWRARLDEIAEWWLARGRTAIEAGSPERGQVVYRLSGDPRARMRLVGGRADVRVDREPLRILALPEDRLPAVGLDPGVPAAVARFLQEDGFLVTTRPDARCAIRLGPRTIGDDQIGLRRRVLTAPHPVLAIDRWPDGVRSALALTGDIDALTMQDFVHRVRENANGVSPSILTAGRS